MLFGEESKRSKKRKISSLKKISTYKKKFLAGNLRKIKYGILKQALKQKNTDVFLSYNLLIEEKVKCF